MCGDSRDHAYHPADPLLPLHESGFGPFQDDSASRHYTTHQPLDSGPYAPQHQQQPASYRQHEAFAPYQHAASAPHQQMSLLPQFHAPCAPSGHAPLRPQSFEASIRHERGVFASEQQPSSYAPHLQPTNYAPQRQQTAFTPQRHAAYSHQPPNGYAPPQPAQTGATSMMSGQAAWEAPFLTSAHLTSGFHDHPQYEPFAPALQDHHHHPLSLPCSMLAEPRNGADQQHRSVNVVPTTSPQAYQAAGYGSSSLPTPFMTPQGASSQNYNPFLAPRNQPMLPPGQQPLPSPLPNPLASLSSVRMPNGKSTPAASSSKRRGLLTHNDIYKLNGQRRSEGAINRALKRALAQPRKRLSGKEIFDQVEKSAGCSIKELERRIGLYYGPWLEGLAATPGGPLIKQEEGEEGQGKGLVAAEGVGNEAQASGSWCYGDVVSPIKSEEQHAVGDVKEEKKE